MEVLSLNAVKLQESTSTLSKKIEGITVKSTTDGTEGQNSVSEANSYHKYDTLELSRDYLEYRTKTESSTVKGDTDQSGSTIEQKVPKMPPNESTGAEKPAVKTEIASQNSVTGDSEEEDISSSELSSYSAAELKGLLQQGKITTADYNAEIKSRQDDTETEKEQTNQQKINKPNNQADKKPKNSIF